MTDAAAVKAFIHKWEQNTQKESSTAKEHFSDLCRLLGVPTPNDPGSGPDIYCFEKSLTKTGGKAGFADVWKRDHFAWEYKGKGKYPRSTPPTRSCSCIRKTSGTHPSSWCRTSPITKFTSPSLATALASSASPTPTSPTPALANCCARCSRSPRNCDQSRARRRSPRRRRNNLREWHAF